MPTRYFSKNLTDAIRFRPPNLPFPLGLLRSRFPCEEVVYDAVPGAMNADEKQQQRRRSNPKEGLADISAPADDPTIT